MRVTLFALIIFITTSDFALSQAPHKIADEFASNLDTPTGTLYGSLIVPSGDSSTTVVLMVPGSGPTDRNGNQMMMRNNSLKMIALELANNNISSLRFDKRGIAASRSAMNSESEIRFNNYIEDVCAWVSKLRRDGRFRKVIIMGHSEGALIAASALNNGARANALISVAGCGRTIDQVLKDQLSQQAIQIRDMAYKIIDSLKMGCEVKQVPFFLSSLFRPSVQPYLRSMMQFNPQSEIRNIKVPVLIIQGDTDIQVGVEDARLLHAANSTSQLYVIAGMNHVLKDCPGTEREYQMPTYANPALPVNQQMMCEIVRFIQHL